MRDMHARGFCPRCLLSELPDGAALAHTVQAWIDGLPDARRADEDVRLARLEQCRRCEYLGEATCELCGCYADFRAAQSDAACPDVPPRWGRADR